MRIMAIYGFLGNVTCIDFVPNHSMKTAAKHTDTMVALRHQTHAKSVHLCRKQHNGRRQHRALATPPPSKAPSGPFFHKNLWIGQLIASANLWIQERFFHTGNVISMHRCRSSMK